MQGQPGGHRVLFQGSGLLGSRVQGLFLGAVTDVAVIVCKGNLEGTECSVLTAINPGIHWRP